MLPIFNISLIGRVDARRRVDAVGVNGTLGYSLAKAGLLPLHSLLL